VQKYPNTTRAMIAAVLDASKFIDVMANRKKVAEIIADKSYVNCPVDVIDQRLEGNYDNGIGRVWKDPDYMKFYNEGAVNYPYLSDGMWFLTQHKRWGLLKEDPDYLAVAQKVNQVEAYSRRQRWPRCRCRRKRSARRSSSTAPYGTARTRRHTPRVSRSRQTEPRDERRRPP
jgi:nitrate/nitrite transport system substrate-binding protein